MIQRSLVTVEISTTAKSRTLISTKQKSIRSGSLFVEKSSVADEEVSAVRLQGRAKRVLASIQ